MIRMAVIIFGLAFGTTVFGANPAPSAVKMPTSTHPELEQVMLQAATGNYPFNDKTIVKISALTGWGEVTTLYAGKETFRFQHATAAVAVFDPDNSKCWLWKVVKFRKYEANWKGNAGHAPVEIGNVSQMQDEISFEDKDIFEIDCKNIGYKK